MPLPDNNIIARLSDVSLSYERRCVLQHINLAIGERDFIVVSGANGAGKSSMLRLLLKLIKPTSGRVSYLYRNEEVENIRIGYLPQKNVIDSRFPITVKDVVLSGLYAMKEKLTSTEQCVQCNSLLQELGLEALKHRSIGMLSGGELQRTLLARAIISQPQLLVLDEPFSYIDAAYTATIRNILARMSQECAIVMVTHQPAIVSDMATHHMTMESGTLSW